MAGLLDEKDADMNTIKQQLHDMTMEKYQVGGTTEGYLTLIKTGCPLQGKFTENRICWRKNPCREKSGNLEKMGKIRKSQGILQKHVREISGNSQPVS